MHINCLPRNIKCNKLLFNTLIPGKDLVQLLHAFTLTGQHSIFDHKIPANGLIPVSCIS